MLARYAAHAACSSDFALGGRFEFAGDAKDQAGLVAWLVGEGYDVVEVTSHKKSLEDVFLQVTEGLVQ